jgi:hypothetical protein
MKPVYTKDIFGEVLNIAASINLRHKNILQPFHSNYT